MDNKGYMLLKNLFPFEGLGKDELSEIYEKLSLNVESFKKGETIFSKEHYEKKIGFVLDGECKVVKKRGGANSLSLNTIGKYGSFGILSLFVKRGEYPTEISAVTDATVLFIEAEDMLKLIHAYPEVSLGVIKFLAKKIIFLGGKINTLSHKSVDAKVAAYLYSAYLKHGDTLSVSMASLSREIDIGRASLYRILSSYEENGLIICEPKKIIFIDPKGLERISK